MRRSPNPARARVARKTASAPGAQRRRTSFAPIEAERVPKEVASPRWRSSGSRARARPRRTRGRPARTRRRWPRRRFSRFRASPSRSPRARYRSRESIRGPVHVSVGDYAGVPASVARVGVVPTRARPRKCVAVRGFFQINISTKERTGAKNELAESRDIVFQSRPRIAFGHFSRTPLAEAAFSLKRPIKSRPVAPKGQSLRDFYRAFWRRKRLWVGLRISLDSTGDSCRQLS